MSPPLRLQHLCPALGCLVLAAVAGQSLAADVTTDLHIDRVTVTGKVLSHPCLK